jgi:hypothetical protein
VEKKPKFKFGQIVYIRATGSSAREGPYKIERVVPDSGNTTFRFTLCDFETFARAKDGRAFSARELELEGPETASV